MTTSTFTHKWLLLKQRDTLYVRVLVVGAGLFVAFVALFSYIQYGTAGLAGNDGYYHIKMGWLIRQYGLTPGFPWLPQTILNPNAYYDHHLLYHVYLALFAGIDPAVDGGAALTQGAKVAGILLPSLAFLAVWWLLRGQSVPYAAVWSLGLFAVSEAFLYRMSMPRAQSASLLVLVLGLHWLLQKRYWALLPLGFVYVWLYNAFPLLMVLAGVYFAAALLVERRWAWPAVLYPAAGVALGILVNPYFPANVTFIANHLLPKIGESAVRVGNEWRPYETWTLVENSGGALAALALGTLALGWHTQRIGRPALVALLLALLFGFMLFKSRRFVEYFPAFALIFLALSAQPVLAEWRAKRPGLALALPLALLLLLAYPLYATTLDARAALARSKPADRYAAASLWLHAHAPAGSVIFQTDWDDFTRLFFYNTNVTYTAGLDPTYLQLYDAELFDTWVDITRGEVERPSAIIRTHFDGDFVFTDLNHGDFLEQAAGDPGLEEVYRDDDAAIFRVVQ